MNMKKIKKSVKKSTKNNYRIEALEPRLLMAAVELSFHTPHYTFHTRIALGGVAPLCGGETRKRLDEPTPDQVRGDERRAAPAPAPGRGTPNSGLYLLLLL